MAMKMNNNAQDIVEAAASGDRLETLIALRGLLAERLRDCESNRDTASMSLRLMSVLAEIEELENRQNGEQRSSIDDIRKRINVDGMRKRLRIAEG